MSTAPAKKACSDERGQIVRVQDLIMYVLEGFGTQRMIDELRSFTRDHHGDCALGSVPACTCGLVEARNFLDLFDGKLRGDQLIR